MFQSHVTSETVSTPFTFPPMTALPQVSSPILSRVPAPNVLSNVIDALSQTIKNTSCNMVGCSGTRVIGGHLCSKCTEICNNYRLTDSDREKIASLIRSLILYGDETHLFYSKYLKLDLLSDDTYELCRINIPKLGWYRHGFSYDIIKLWYPSIYLGPIFGCDDENVEAVTELLAIF